MTKTVLFLILIFGSLSLRAEQRIAGVVCSEANVRTLAIQSLVLAQEKGWKKVGDASLTELQTAIKTQPITIVCHNDLKIYSGGRSTGRYDVTKGIRKIQIFEGTWNKMDLYAQQTLALHEHLGVLGFQDQNYEIGLRIGLMALKPAKSDSILDKLPSGSKAQSLSGGTTIIGGGGDGGELYFRASFLMAYLNAVEQIPRDSQSFEKAKNAFDIAVATRIDFIPTGPLSFQPPEVYLLSASESSQVSYAVRVGLGFISQKSVDEFYPLLGKKMVEAINKTITARLQ